MPDDLVVHLNRGERHALDPAASSLAVAESFEVVVENHGDGSHVNVGLDGDLAAGGAVATPNPFVPAGESVRIAVDVTTDHRPLEGTLAIATGYGRTRIELPVSVVSPRQNSVDADPTPTRANGGRSVPSAPREILTSLDGEFDPGTAALVVLAAIALVLALATAILIDSIVVVLAVLVVVLAVSGGVATALRS